MMSLVVVFSVRLRDLLSQSMNVLIIDPCRQRTHLGSDLYHTNTYFVFATNKSSSLVYLATFYLPTHYLPKLPDELRRQLGFWLAADR